MGWFGTKFSDPHAQDVGWLASQPIDMFANFVFSPNYGGNKKRALTTMNRLGHLIYRLETGRVHGTLFAAKWYLKRLTPHLNNFTAEQRSYIQPLINRLTRAVDQVVQSFGVTDDRCNAEMQNIDRLVEFGRNCPDDLLFGIALYTHNELMADTPSARLSRFVSRCMWSQG